MAWTKQSWEITQEEALREAKGCEQEAQEMEQEGHHEIAGHLREDRDDWRRVAQLIRRLI